MVFFALLADSVNISAVNGLVGNVIIAELTQLGINTDPSASHFRYAISTH